MTSWVGVDVGGSRKGFHIATLASDAVIELQVASDVDEAEAVIRSAAPAVVAVDSPISTAPPGATARDCELTLNRRICGIRWTPDAARVLDPENAYYDWIRNGLRLYERLAGLEVVECFPTASFTRWGGARGSTPRGAWSQRILESHDLRLPGRRLAQDDRDAIAAALTARAWSTGEAERIGEIVVPLESPAGRIEDELPQLIRIVEGHADTWALSSDASVLLRVAGALANSFRSLGVTKVAAVEARGFVLGTAVALELGAGLVPIRKEAGMLPGRKHRITTEADYRGRSQTLSIQAGALGPDDLVLLVDDWAETGASALAARTLVERCGARWAGVSVVVDQLRDERAAELGRYEALVRADALSWEP